MSSTFSEVRAGAARISAGPIARNVAFISNLMESGVEFTAVDFPQANRLTVHILAAVAEHEAEIISKRTKEALAAAKRRGVKLGGYHGGCFTEKARKSGPEALKVQAKARAADLKPVIDDIRATGAISYGAIARELRARSVPTPRGGTWSPMQVSRLLTLID